MHFGQKIVNGLACIKASGLSFFFSFLFFFPLLNLMTRLFIMLYPRKMLIQWHRTLCYHCLKHVFLLNVCSDLPLRTRAKNAAHAHLMFA